VSVALSDVVPWLWCAVALVAGLRTRGRGARSWWPPSAAAALLASLHLGGWNKPIYLLGKRLVAWTGLYEERLWFKFAIAAVFFPLVAWACWRAWRWSACLSPLQRIALLAMAIDALYVTVRTLSVDGWLPEAIGVEPGKSLLGTGLAAVALLAVVVARPRAASEERHAT
jgi:hypothetical protein